VQIVEADGAGLAVGLKNRKTNDGGMGSLVGRIINPAPSAE